MAGHGRVWDENSSPQWKYLLGKEARERRKTKKDLEKLRREEYYSPDAVKKVAKGKRRKKSLSGKVISDQIKTQLLQQQE
jgi:hypothetical protein